jgi:intein/homing endonuclease
MQTFPRNNPGTREGRKLGGIRSLETHRSKNTGFKLLKKIQIPQPSIKLAELIGIFMGDGHVHKYQATVCTNSDTDKEHAFYIKELIENLFSIQVALNNRSNKLACTIVVSSKEVCRFLVSQGLPQGNKITLGLTIPDWIISDDTFRRAFLRGLIDTDGCVYQDKHMIKGKIYSSTCIAFTSASVELRDFVYQALCSEGLSPSLTNRDVRLRRRKEVLEYVKIVGFSNPKHSRKITV